ncbi:MAG: glycosyltransferase family 2 protein [Panacibacter sp.]
MKVSIITAAYNSSATIEKCLASVRNQTYKNIEHIIVDGASKDNTLEVVKNFGHYGPLISEPDKGIYDAMNKGIKIATGDIVGTLNSDDFFYDENVVSKVVTQFLENNVEATIADIVFVNKNDDKKILRKYSAKKWRPQKFAWGYMPPHPSFFVKRSLFNEFGFYETNYKIAADYELLLRYLLIHKIKWSYLPLITTKMLPGGVSTKNLNSIITLNKEIARACKANGLYTNYAMIYSKYFFKPFEFLLNG